jgi:hypothetical protein
MTMEVHNEQMSSVRHFWQTSKIECLNIQSIDAVYDRYKEYHKTYANKAGETYNHPALHKYKFRVFIRKNGYDNSTPKQNSNNPINPNNL